MMFNKGIVNKHLELIKLGLKYGAISKLSTVSYEYEGEKITGGVPGLTKLFEDNQEKCDELLRKIQDAKASGVEEQAIKLSDSENPEDEDAELEALLFAAKVDDE